jgi:hypothetical protein
MGRDIHDKDVADAPASTKASLPLRNGPKELIRVQTPLHEQLGLAEADELDSLFSRRLAMGDINDLKPVKIEV